MFQIQKLEKDKTNSIHNQGVQKEQQKYWHDRNIRTKNISTRALVLLYDIKIKGKPRKLETTWVGLYIVKEMNSNGLVRLKTLQG